MIVEKLRIARQNGFEEYQDALRKHLPYYFEICGRLSTRLLAERFGEEILFIEEKSVQDGIWKCIIVHNKSGRLTHRLHFLNEEDAMIARLLL